MGEYLMDEYLMGCLDCLGGLVALATICLR
jgi:hypothetical protein